MGLDPAVAPFAAVDVLCQPLAVNAERRHSSNEELLHQAPLGVIGYVPCFEVVNTFPKAKYVELVPELAVIAVERCRRQKQDTSGSRSVCSEPPVDDLAT